MIRQLASMFAAAGSVYGINRRNVELVYPHNPRHLRYLADDKLETKERLVAAGVPVPELLCTCVGLFQVEATLAGLAGEENFVLKPAQGAGGRGLLVIGARESERSWRQANGTVLTRDQIAWHLANVVLGAYSRDIADRAFVERRVTPHPLYHALWSHGLSDVRVIVAKGRAIIAMVRVPTARSGGRANLHQGGIGLSVDLQTGVVNRAWSGRSRIVRHPDSGQALEGLQTPSWPEVVATAEKAASSIPLGYLGVDVVVDDGGRALVLEVNARPGLEIQNVCGVGLGSALEGIAER